MVRSFSPLITNNLAHLSKIGLNKVSVLLSLYYYLGTAANIFNTDTLLFKPGSSTIAVVVYICQLQLLLVQLSNVQQLVDAADINALKRARERSETCTIVSAALRDSKVLKGAYQTAGGESH